MFFSVLSEKESNISVNPHNNSMCALIKHFYRWIISGTPEIKRQGDRETERQRGRKTEKRTDRCLLYICYIKMILISIMGL